MPPQLIDNLALLALCTVVEIARVPVAQVDTAMAP